VFLTVSFKNRPLLALDQELVSTTHMINVSPSTAILLRDGQQRTRSGEMARVACTLVAKGWIGGVLCSQVAWTWTRLGGSVIWVHICKLKCCICRVVRKPRLGIKAVRIVVTPREKKT
jgi:hypothetical protein